MTITIPAWALWALGIPIGLVVLAFAWFGFVVARSLGKGGFWR